MGQIEADAGADFAAWCSYKYLNGGPGAVGGAFVHERHFDDPALPRLAGWWGHEASTRFEMGPDFRAAHGAAGWAVSNPPVFSTAPLRAALPLFVEAGMAALRHKSVALTGYLEWLLQRLAAGAVEIVTPVDPTLRGCQLSLRLKAGGRRGREVFDALGRADVVCDWRDPDVIRLAPVPLYNRFEDVFDAATRLSEIVRS
jgi:kynureninase